MTTANAYTLEDILALRPCDPDQRRALFADARTLTAREALGRGATVRDLLWVAGKMGRKADCVRFAIACARAVAHLNTDPRVMAAIDAAQAWVDAPSDAAAAAADAAVDAAASAADAARAVAYAASAAYAAASAAYAAAYAATTTAVYAAAAAYAARADAADADDAADAAADAAAAAARAADLDTKAIFLAIVEGPAS